MGDLIRIDPGSLRIQIDNLTKEIAKLKENDVLHAAQFEKLLSNYKALMVEYKATNKMLHELYQELSNPRQK
jgi:hypothetical protein